MWPDRGGERARGRRWLAIGVSLAVHSLLFLVVIHGHLPEVPGRESSLIYLAPVPDVERTTPARFYVPLVEQGRGTRRAPVPPLNPVPTDSVTTPEQPVIAPAPEESVAVVRRSPAGRIGPALGDGRLWVRPLPVPPKELAARLGKSHVELVDSAVTRDRPGISGFDRTGARRRSGQAPRLDGYRRREEVRTRLAEHLHRRAQDSGRGAGAAADSEWRATSCTRSITPGPGLPKTCSGRRNGQTRSTSSSGR